MNRCTPVPGQNFPARNWPRPRRCLWRSNGRLLDWSVLGRAGGTRRLVHGDYWHSCATQLLRWAGAERSALAVPNRGDIRGFCHGGLCCRCGRDQRSTWPRLVRAADSSPRLAKLEIRFAGILLIFNTRATQSLLPIFDSIFSGLIRIC